MTKFNSRVTHSMGSCSRSAFGPRIRTSSPPLVRQLATTVSFITTGTYWCRRHARLSGNLLSPTVWKGHRRSCSRRVHYSDLLCWKSNEAVPQAAQTCLFHARDIRSVTQYSLQHTIAVRLATSNHHARTTLLLLSKAQSRLHPYSCRFASQHSRVARTARQYQPI